MVKDRWERVLFALVLSALVLGSALAAVRARKDRPALPVAASKQRA
ncbi:MAG: hypothetical protein FD180_3384 [Planctomycetota bacterium]|nr:MAG: hypothetical protein FD180_3384 [Planctomycetota bacterium]